MINFNLTFEKNADGFTPNKAQREALKLAARQWGSQFANNATIDLAIESTSSASSQVLMEAGSELKPTATEGFGNVEVVRNKVLTGADLNGAEQDGLVRVNWGKNWELDFNETPSVAEEEYDFYGIFYHELNHALGFLSQIGPFGRGAYLGNTRTWGAFDQYVTDSKGESVFNPDGSLNVVKYQKLQKEGSSKDNKGLFFSGPNAKAANGGRSVGLYTPDVIRPEELAHLDDENPDLDGSLMEATKSTGPAVRTLSDIEKGIFKDLGYSFVGEASSENPDPENPEADEVSAVEITSLNNGNTITLQLDQVGSSDISELIIFSTDDARGTNRKQIASFSILEGEKLTDDYSPSFSVDRDEIAVGKFLQFELTENGKTRSAAPTFLPNNKVSLDFGEGTILSFQPTRSSNKTNLLLDDAATIDLSGQGRNVEVSFNVYREAGYDNTVGFYETDTADGTIVIDPILGIRVSPGEAGYKEAALARRLETQLTGENGRVTTFSADMAGGGFLGTFLIVDGSDFGSDDIYFSHGAVNSNGDDHVKMLGNNTFGFEDLAGLGDQDYNDIVVAFDVA